MHNKNVHYFKPSQLKCLRQTIGGGASEKTYYENWFEIKW